MTDERNDLPNPSANNYDQRVRETLMTYMGRQGNPLDRGLTMRDMLDAGLIAINDGAKLTTGMSRLPIKSGPNITADTLPDLTPPPTPEGFEVHAGFTQIMIEHDPATFTQGHGHLRTVVYGKVRAVGEAAPVFAHAVKVAEFGGSVFSMPSAPATTWHLWIKWETNDGVLSADPAGGTNGQVAITGQDVSKLLEAMTGEITESQLYGDLTRRIDLVDGPATMVNSVADKVKAEAEARGLAIEAEAKARTDALIDQARTIGASITTVSESVQTLSESYGKHVISITAGLGDAVAAATTETGVRVSAEDVIAKSVTAMGGRMGTAEAWINTETSTRLEKDKATGRILDAIGLTVDDPITGVAATSAKLIRDYSTTIDAKQFVHNSIVDFSGEVYDPVTGAVKSALNSEIISSKVDAELMMGTKITNFGNEIKDPVKGVIASAISSGVIYSKIDAKEAVSTEIKTTQSKFMNPETGLINDAAIQTTLFTRTDAKEAIANEIKSYKATVGGKTFSEIEIQANTAASDAGALKSQYTVKLNTVGTNGVLAIAGFGLASEPTAAGGMTSQFLVNADRFAVVSGTDGGTYAPFTVQGVDEVLPNGTELKKGVYMDAAFIRNATITGAMVVQGTIEDMHVTELNATKLTAGEGIIGDRLKSQNNNDANTQGWRIEPNGNATFNGVVVRGTVYADAGRIGGLTLTGGVIHSSGVTPPPLLVEPDLTRTRPVKQVVATGSGTPSTILVLQDGEVMGFGYWESGLFGAAYTAASGLTAGTPMPIALLKNPNGTPFITNVAAADAGENFLAFLKHDGTVWFIGGSIESVMIPNLTMIAGVSDVVSISAAQNFLVMLTASGQVYVRGQQRDALCHNIEVANQNWDAPLNLVAYGFQGSLRATRVMKITAGGYHFAMLDSNGYVWTAGQNFWGEMGVELPTEKGVHLFHIHRTLIDGTRKHNYTISDIWAGDRITMFAIKATYPHPSGTDVGLLAGGLYSVGCEMPFRNPKPGVFGDAWVVLPVPYDPHLLDTRHYPKLVCKSADTGTTYRVVIGGGINGVPGDYRRAIIRQQGAYNHIFCLGFEGFERDLPVMQMKPAKNFSGVTQTIQNDFLYKGVRVNTPAEAVSARRYDSPSGDRNESTARPMGDVFYIKDDGDYSLVHPTDSLYTWVKGKMANPFMALVPGGESYAREWLTGSKELPSDIRYGYPNMRLDTDFPNTYQDGYNLRATEEYGSGVVLDRPTATEKRHVNKGLYSVDEVHTQTGIPIYNNHSYDLTPALDTELRWWNTYIGPLTVCHINEVNAVYTVADATVFGAWTGLYAQDFTSQYAAQYINKWRERLRSLRSGAGFTTSREDPSIPFGGSGFGVKSNGNFMFGNSAGNNLTFNGSALSYRGSLDVKSSTDTNKSRMEITDDCIKVYEGSQLRVVIGRLP